MDTSAIITQVTPPNAAAAASSLSDNDHTTCTTSEQTAKKGCCESSVVSGVVSPGVGNGGTKKKKSRFLCSMLCCFGGNRRRRRQSIVDSGGGTSLHDSDKIPLPPTGAHSSSSSKALLPILRPEDINKKCIVIDLDETLVHSSFKPINNADFIVPVEIDGTIHQVYVLKRPFVDEFLCRMGELYECVLFTASLAKYADPVADLLDKWDVFSSRLFRESCVFHRGNYVKDLSRLGREIHKILIVDNSPASYIFHPDNAIPVASWFDDMNDRELLDLIPFLENLSKVDSVYSILQNKVDSTSSSIKKKDNTFLM